MNIVPVKLGPRSYKITIGRGILRHLSSGLKKVLPSNKIVILTNKRIAHLYKRPVQNILRKKFNIHWIELPEGERTKNIKTIEKIIHQMIKFGADRKTGLLAFGGGVIGDIGGFAAATYMRGIPYVQIPTTLLSQVDSSVGGKTGVDLSEGKNLVGAFYQPKWVIIDTEFLFTLPKREFRCGMSEVVKYGLLWDSKFFRYIEKNVGKIQSLHHNTLEFLIKRSCQIKALIVSRDEREKGLRSLLNLGHTLGHAIETIKRYRGIKHGEAVSCGMVYAAHLSNKKGLLSQRELRRISELLKTLGLPVRWPRHSKKAYQRAIAADKKMTGNKIKFVCLKKIGKASCMPLTVKEVTRYL